MITCSTVHTPYPSKSIHFIHAPITRIATSPECGCGYDVLALFTPCLWVSLNVAPCDADADLYTIYIFTFDAETFFYFRFFFLRAQHGRLAYADTDYTLHTYRLIFVVYMHIDIENTLPYLFQVPLALERSDEKHNCKQIPCKYNEEKKWAKSEQGQTHRCISHNGVGYPIEIDYYAKIISLVRNILYRFDGYGMADSVSAWVCEWTIQCECERALSKMTIIDPQYSLLHTISACTARLMCMCPSERISGVLTFSCALSHCPPP